MKRISASKEKSSFWPGALSAEGQIFDETGREWSVWAENWCSGPILAKTSQNKGPLWFFSRETIKTKNPGGLFFIVNFQNGTFF